MQTTNLALALDTPADVAPEELRDELAQFISEELIASPEIDASAQNAHTRPALKIIKRRLSLWSGNSMDTRFSRRRIHVDNGMFSRFRVR